jgi:hypothetical protein
MRHARQRQSQVCGVHGRVSSGFGQQVHLWALSIPHPGGMVISPGRRVVRRFTRPHRPWLVAQAPTHSSSRRAPPSRSRMAARPPYSPAVEPVGGGLGAAGDPKARQPAASSATVPCSDSRSASGRPYVCALTRQVWPVDQAISPSPRSGRDVAGANRRAMSTAARSRVGHARQLCTAMVVPGSHPPAVRHGSARLPYAEPGPGRPIPVTAMRPVAARPR